MNYTLIQFSSILLFLLENLYPYAPAKTYNITVLIQSFEVENHSLIVGFVLEKHDKNTMGNEFGFLREFFPHSLQVPFRYNDFAKLNLPS